MRLTWWMLLMAPDGSGTGAEGGKPGDGGAGAGGSGSGGSGGGAGDGGKGGEGDKGKAGDDLAGLKSALEKERQAAKELRQQLAELKAMATKGEDSGKELESLKKKLAEYDFRETKDAALAKAVEAATKDGKFAVDVDKAKRLAAKLTDAKTLDADLAEIVDLLKVEKAAGGTEKKAAPPIKGQPAKGAEGQGELPHSEWAKLYKEDPEAYKQMIEERRKRRLA